MASIRERRLIIMFWIIALGLGGLQAWCGCRCMNEDGVSYLDIGDAYFRGQRDNAISAYWSPMYSWLLGFGLFVLKPSMYSEAAVVHFINFLIYLCALGCFHFFWKTLTDSYKAHVGKLSADKIIPLPEWAWWSWGYTLFIWSSIDLITVVFVSPDMGVACIFYLVSGILLRIRNGCANNLNFCLLGLVLGLGYLTKTILFPLSFVFLGISCFSGGSLRKTWPKVLLALACFSLIAGPFIGLISQKKGYLTFGEVGKVSYIYFVSGGNHLPGKGPSQDLLKKIHDDPEIYEFGAQVGGTYPHHYDPSYEWEGEGFNFQMDRQIRAIAITARRYFRFFFEWQGALVTGVLILYLLNYGNGTVVKAMFKRWDLILPSICAMSLYLVVGVVDPRHVGAVIVLFWGGILSGVFLPDSSESRRLMTRLSLVVLILMMIRVGTSTMSSLSWLRDQSEDRVQWKIAEGLQRLGIQKGDKVGVVGHSCQVYWARLAGVRVAAEMPETDRFWRKDLMTRFRAIEAFRKVGAKVLVTSHIPTVECQAGWTKVEHSEYYLYPLLPLQSYRPD
jgi:hypothetical protein